MLNSKQQVIGYELSWLQPKIKPLDVQELNALFGFVADHFIDPEHGWLLPNNFIFLEIVPVLFHASALKLLPPKNIVLTIRRAYLLKEPVLAAVKKLRAQGYGICLRDADPKSQSNAVMTLPDQTILGLISHIEVTGTSILAIDELAALKQRSIQTVARQLRTQQDYEVCIAKGFDVFAVNLRCISQPQSSHHLNYLNAAQTWVVQLMELVRRQVDIVTLEALLQHDGELPYRLLHYMNSDGFGVRPPLHSLHQALQLPSYGALYRWLTVLLATASNKSYSPVLIEAAMIRGRFVELIGIDQLSAGDAEYLFVTGMCSLSDQWLNVSLEYLLKVVDFPEAVSQALSSRKGKFGAYLSLVEACELSSPEANQLAQSLHISIADVNQTHISALIWVKNVMKAIGCL